MERGTLLRGRYEVLERLGRGGMGEVWAGRDRELSRDVALKLLPVHEDSPADLTARFEREAVAAAQVNHPNVVALYDRGAHADTLFLVMELVDGVPLSTLIETSGVLPLARTLELAEQVCAGLEATHRAGVVHFDVKPQNVMITGAGTVKVVDFGIAGFLQAQRLSVVRSSRLAPAATLEYAAPEQFTGEHGDARCDLYALGGVLFTMLTGHPPFPGKTAWEVMAAKISGDAPRLDKVRPGLPPALVDLVAQLLERDPAARPLSARDAGRRLAWMRTGSGDEPAAGVTLVEEGFAQAQPPRNEDGEGNARPVRGPRQLPADTGLFTGREDELRVLFALAEQARAGGEPGTVVISAIDGMGGVGKTALAIRAAHRLAPRFPDGQLFLDLYGFAPGHEPRDPADALAAMLVALGVTPDEIPAHVDDRAAAYRDRLAGTRTLVVLDNALDEAQVRPLLPGAENCLVLITSRRRLKALDDALPVALDVLEPDAAAELLRRTARLGERVEPEDRELLPQVAELCGYLPLTLVIVGALVRAGGRPWSLRHVAAQLEERQPEGRELERYTDGGRNLSKVFDLSYRRLPTKHRLFFRRLGLVPGPEIDSHAAASLHSTDRRTATSLLDGLRDQNLVTEVGPGRYRMHDLIRAYTREIAVRDSAADRERARDRLFEYYEDAAGSRLDGRDADARAWLCTERENLEAAFEYAVAHRLDRHTAALSKGITRLLTTDGPWPAAVAANRSAVEATTRLGCFPDQAEALASLGASHSRIGDYAGATDALTSALGLYRALGDRARQARMLMQLGHIRWMTGDYAGAERDHREALPLLEAVGDRAGQARILTERGEIRRMTGDLAEAERDQLAAARLFGELGRPGGRARTLNMLGEVRYLKGEHAAAARDLEEARDIYRELGDRFGEANSLTYLADVRAATGDGPGALRDVDRAVEVFRELGSRSNEAWAVGHQAAIVAHTGDHARALPLFRKALSMAREVTQPDDEALALEGIGECLVLEAEVGDAVRHLDDALQIFRRLGMRPEIERVTRRLAELRQAA